MKICYFGTYEKEYPRNRVIIKGLRKNNIDVIECHVPVWELTKDKTGDFFKKSSLIKLSFQILWGYIRLIKKYLTIEKYDILMVGYIGQMDIFLAKFLTLLNKRPIVFNPLISLFDTLVNDRKVTDEKSLKAKILHLIDKWSCNLADIIILDTNEHIKYFQKEFGIDKNKLTRIFVGADEKIFFPRKVENKNTSFKVFFYAKFTPLHGLPYILKATKLLEEDKNIQFEIIGTGQISSEIHDLAKELQIKNINFINWVAYRELPNHIANADVCLGIFGDTEKAKRVIPNKTFQALAMGKPLITGNSPAAREILTNKKNAILCEMANSEALAESILFLKNDDALRNNMASEGYKLFRESLTSSILCKPLKPLFEGLTDH